MRLLGKILATVSRVRWHHSRLPRGRWLYRADIEIPGGIPIPGKGENSWDCEDDAIYAQTQPVSPTSPCLREIVDDLALSVLRRRMQYASLSWRPTKGWRPDLAGAK